LGRYEIYLLKTILAVHEFAEIGVVLLLFLIGLEIQLDQLRRLGRDVLAFGVPQIILSALLIGLYVWWGFAEWEASLVLGLGFAQSSTVVVIQLLKERDELHSTWGSKAFAILLAQDLAIVPLLLLVSFMAERKGAGSAGGPWLWAVAWAAVAVVGIIGGGRYVLPRILAIAEKQKNGPAFTCISLLGVLAAALASESVGLSMALGTFLLGMMLSMSSFSHRIAAIVDPVQDTTSRIVLPQRWAVGGFADCQPDLGATSVQCRSDPADEIHCCLRPGAGPARRQGGCAASITRSGTVRRIRLRPVRHSAGRRSIYR
jgi:glutathione-regulated potassium-efflux system ancillary protein KefC